MQHRPFIHACAQQAMETAYNLRLDDAKWRAGQRCASEHDSRGAREIPCPRDGAEEARRLLLAGFSRGRMPAPRSLIRVLRTSVWSPFPPSAVSSSTHQNQGQSVGGAYTRPPNSATSIFG
eukprot:GHVU01069763.1.p2 GENE.GHVU01069763.1~~GHVU01069763.1.p2  ORF type:complete len:121 (+),score=7.37 GHVU01069763.1:288-650(+)